MAAMEPHLMRQMKAAVPPRIWSAIEAKDKGQEAEAISQPKKPIISSSRIGGMDEEERKAMYAAVSSAPTFMGGGGGGSSATMPIPRLSAAPALGTGAAYAQDPAERTRARAGAGAGEGAGADASIVAETAGGLQDNWDRSDLADATLLVGKNLAMCSEAELADRLRSDDLLMMERPDDSYTKADGTPWRVEELVVKKFKRPTPGVKLNDPAEVRPPEWLDKTMTHLEEHCMAASLGFSWPPDTPGNDPRIAEAATRMKWTEENVYDEVQFELYKFIWDRTRMIRSDFNMQGYNKTVGRVDRTAIDVYERIGRWHIMEDHKLHDNASYNRGNNAAQNEAQLMATLSVLDDLYSLAHQQITSGAATEDILGKHEAELRSYYLMQLFQQDAGMKVLERVQQLSAEAPLVFESSWVQRALKVFTAFKEGNYAYFFSVLRAAPYLFKCCMFKYVGAMRQEALQVMRRSYKLYPVTDMVELLCFENDEEATDFFTTYGLPVEADATGEMQVVFSGNSLLELARPVAPWRMERTIEAASRGLEPKCIVRGEAQAADMKLPAPATTRVRLTQARKSVAAAFPLETTTELALTAVQQLRQKQKAQVERQLKELEEKKAAIIKRKLEEQIAENKRKKEAEEMARNKAGEEAKAKAERELKKQREEELRRKIEEEKKAKALAEAARLEKERALAEKKKKEKQEAEARLAQERAKAAELAEARRREEQRQAEEKARRLALEEAARVERERLEKERKERERLEQERRERERLERERRERERERERQRMEVVRQHRLQRACSAWHSKATEAARAKEVERARKKRCRNAIAGIDLRQRIQPLPKRPRQQAQGQLQLQLYQPRRLLSGLTLLPWAQVGPLDVRRAVGEALRRTRESTAADMSIALWEAGVEDPAPVNTFWKLLVVCSSTAEVTPLALWLQAKLAGEGEETEGSRDILPARLLQLTPPSQSLRLCIKLIFLEDVGEQASLHAWGANAVLFAPTLTRGHSQKLDWGTARRQLESVRDALSEQPLPIAVAAFAGSETGMHVTGEDVTEGLELQKLQKAGLCGDWEVLILPSELGKSEADQQLEEQERTELLRQALAYLASHAASQPLVVGRPIHCLLGEVVTSVLWQQSGGGGELIAAVNAAVDRLAAHIGSEAQLSLAWPLPDFAEVDEASNAPVVRCAAGVSRLEGMGSSLPCDWNTPARLRRSVGLCSAVKMAPLPAGTEGMMQGQEAWATLRSLLDTWSDSLPQNALIHAKSLCLGAGGGAGPALVPWRRVLEVLLSFRLEVVEKALKGDTAAVYFALCADEESPFSVDSHGNSQEEQVGPLELQEYRWNDGGEAAAARGSSDPTALTLVTASTTGTAAGQAGAIVVAEQGLVVTEAPRYYPNDDLQHAAAAALSHAEHHSLALEDLIASHVPRPITEASHSQLKSQAATTAVEPAQLRSLLDQARHVLSPLPWLYHALSHPHPPQQQHAAENSRFEALLRGAL
ncbi:unnamed protein product [Chrysoparadoxa australica]